MKEIMRFNWGRSRASDHRGVSPVIGLIILIGMVIAGIAVVLVTGSAMVDTLESGAEQEKVQMCMDETDHRLATVASTGQEQPMDFDGQTCRPEVGSNGEITVTWYDDPTNIDWNNDVESVELGALEFDTGDRTLAHQGGGVWELTGSGARVERAPPIGFDEDDSLQLQFMRLDPASSGGSFTKAVNDHTEAVSKTEELADFAENPEGDHFAIRIESEYADGWERHFENVAEETSQIESDDISRVSDDVVVVEIENLGTGSAGSEFAIASNDGLVDSSRSAISDNLLPTDEEFRIDADIKNTGDTSERVEATLTISEADPDGDTIETRDIESTSPLDSEDTIALSDQGEWPDGTDDIQFDPDDIGLSEGGAYEYNITTDHATLDQPETFYYLDDDANYTVTDISSTYDGAADEITLEAEVRNLGTEDGGEKPVTLEIRQDEGAATTATATTDVELDEFQEANVSWTIDETEWQKGWYYMTVTTPDHSDGASGWFEVPNGGGFVIEEDLGVPEEQRVGTADGQVITNEEPVTINATIANTDTTERTQTVTLEVLDDNGNVVDDARRTVTVDGDATKHVELTGTADLEAGELYEYTISTGTDELDDPGSFLVVEEPSDFQIRHLTPINDPVAPGESLRVAATIENLDATDEQFVWLEGFNDTVAAVEEVEIGAGETKQVTLEWGAVDAPQSADHTIMVGTGTDNETTAVDVQPLLEVTDVEVLEESVRQGGSATVEADLTAVGGDVDQTVALEGFDGDRVDSERVSIAAGDTETVRLSYRNVGDRTDRVTVTTENDEAEDVVVVERNGPNCNRVDYDGRGTTSNPYQVSTVDQLQCIDEDLDSHYELVDDIDAHGTEYWNDGAGFEPIGEQWQWGAEFTGDFNGNGHAIEGLHIDRPDEDFVGLFGVTSQFHGGGDGIGTGSTIQNLRLENVSVHGRQVTGGAIGAAGGTVENVRVSGTVEAEYQEVGGIVGSAHNADLDNRLVSEATVRGGLPAQAAPGADHPWSANNLGIGGIVGATGYNTQVSTAYSQADVEGPFGVGGIVGWTSDYASENEQMYWAEGDITITIDDYPHDAEHYLDRLDRSSYEDNTGGAIFGRGDDEGDGFDDSVYYNGDHHDHPFGEHVIGYRLDVTDRRTDEMQGLGVKDSGNLSELDYEDEGGPWVALPDDYPRFAWELAAEGRFDVAIDDVENVTAGEAAEIEATVTSRYATRDGSDVTQTISLTDPAGNTVDTQSVTLPSTLGRDESEHIRLVWQTSDDDTGTGDVTVRSEDADDSEPIRVEAAAHGTGKSFGPELGSDPDGGRIDDKDTYDLKDGTSVGTSTAEFDPDIDVGVDVIEID